MEHVVLSNLGQLAEIIKKSNHKPVLIFKHSTRCGISRSVRSKFESDLNEVENVIYCYLDILSNRSISNEISEMFEVEHQSPQLIVIKGGIAVANFSHYDIVTKFYIKDYM